MTKEDEMLIFVNDKTNEKVGVYYNTWLFIIKSILTDYADKTIEEADEILKKCYYKKLENFYRVLCMSHDEEYHWAMLGAYGEQYWLRGISSTTPDGYDEWYSNLLKNNNLNDPFVWF